MPRQIRNSVIPLAEPSINWREYVQLVMSLRGGWLTQSGSQVKKMEASLTDFLARADQPNHKVSAVSNGTTALHLALLSINVGPGDEVVIPNYSYIAVANAVSYVGATLIPCDVDRKTGCLDARELRKLITSRTKAVIVVDNYGVLADYESIRDITPSTITIIQDAAESFPGPNIESIYGNQGDITTFSFYANKVVTAGEGGAIRASAEILKRVNYLKSQAQVSARNFTHGEVGFNYRITNMQAAIFNAQWKKLKIILSKRVSVFAAYVREIEKHNLDITHNGDLRNNPWLFCVRSESIGLNRDRIRLSLNEVGVETRPGFTPISQHDFFGIDNKLAFSRSDALAAQTLCLPTFPNLSAKQIKYVVSHLKSALCESE